MSVTKDLNSDNQETNQASGWTRTWNADRWIMSLTTLTANAASTISHDSKLFYFIPHYFCLKRQDEQKLPPKELYIITRMKPAHVMVCSPVRLVHLCQWVKMLMLLWTDHDTQFINVDQTNIIITTNMFIVLTIRLTHYNLLD